MPNQYSFELTSGLQSRRRDLPNTVQKGVQSAPWLGQLAASSAASKSARDTTAQQVGAQTQIAGVNALAKAREVVQSAYATVGVQDLANQSRKYEAEIQREIAKDTNKSNREIQKGRNDALLESTRINSGSGGSSTLAGVGTAVAGVAQLFKPTFKPIAPPAPPDYSPLIQRYLNGGSGGSSGGTSADADTEVNFADTFGTGWEANRYPDAWGSTGLDFNTAANMNLGFTVPLFDWSR